MADQMEGYVCLSKREEQEAHKFFAEHGHEVPDMNEGDSLGGKPVICGLAEHPVTGRLMIPRSKNSRQLRDIAIQAVGLTDREWKVWRLHCKRNSSGVIAEKLGINGSSVTRSLRSIKSKITVARERAKSVA